MKYEKALGKVVEFDNVDVMATSSTCLGGNWVVGHCDSTTLEGKTTNLCDVTLVLSKWFSEEEGYPVGTYEESGLDDLPVTVETPSEE